jgi:hypothetical protein
VTGPVIGDGVVNVNGNFTSENVFFASAFNVNSGGRFNMEAGVTAPVTVANGAELVLTSDQTITGRLANSGTVDAGGKTLTVAGAYAQASGALFKTSIDDIGPGGYGRLMSTAALDIADGAIIFAAFGSSQKYARGTIVQDVLSGAGPAARAGKITVQAQGQPVDDRYSWNAVWDGSNVDLVVDVYDGARSRPSLSSISQAKTPVLGLMHQRYAMLNAAMAYDCPRFDTYGLCVSMQARATGFGDQTTGAGALDIAWRVTDRVRIGAFLDYQAAGNDAFIGGFPLAEVHANDNSATFGGYAGYRSGVADRGLELFLSGGVNPGRATITRRMSMDANGFVDAQPGTGSASLDAWFVRAMARYGIALSDRLTLSPYGGVRYTDVTRGAYVESANHIVTQPLAYDAYYERLVTAFGGVELKSMLTGSLGAFVALGVEKDIRRHANNFVGQSVIPGLTLFSLDHGGSWNGLRPSATIGAFYDISPRHRLSMSGSAGQQAWTTRAFATGALGYQMAF